MHWIYTETEVKKMKQIIITKVKTGFIVIESEHCDQHGAESLKTVIKIIEKVFEDSPELPQDVLLDVTPETPRSASPATKSQELYPVQPVPAAPLTPEPKQERTEPTTLQKVKEQAQMWEVPE